MKIKKLGLLATTAIALSALASASVFAAKPPPGEKGNGLPKISMKDAWQMNIHATGTCPSASYDGSNRRTVVVQSVANINLANQAHNAGSPDNSTKNNIELAPSTVGFHVMDGNACDNDPAQVLMPTDVASNFDVYVKLRGKPGTKIDPVLCGYDDGTDTTICHTGTTIKTRSSGQDKFKDFTRQLMGVQDTLDVCQGGTCDLFEDGLEGYFWDWSATSGAKATLVFVPCSTSKTGDDPSTQSCVF